MTEQEKCETCKEVCRLDGYPEESRARYCKVKDKYINSDDNQCYIGKTYINVVIAARQQEPDGISFVVTLDQIHRWMEYDYGARDFFNEIQKCPQLAEHDAAIREDERNRVITAFIEKGYTRIETVAPLEGIHLGWVLLSDVKSCLESLRATTQAPGNRQEPEKERDYQCGDECHGECSGEYDGRIHCPVSEAEQRIADVIAELEKRSKQAETIGDNGRIVLAYQEAISLLKNGVKQ